MKFYQSYLFQIAIALLLMAPFSGYAIVVFVPAAAVLLVVDFFLRQLIGDRKKLRIAQLLALPLLLLLWFIPKSQDSVYLTAELPESFVGEVGIFTGVPGAPPLSSDTATIKIPADGLFITSTRIGKDVVFETNLSRQQLPYFLLTSPPSNEVCGGYKTVFYRVSNVDSIRFVPDTFSHSRCHVFYDSLIRACFDAMQ